MQEEFTGFSDRYRNDEDDRLVRTANEVEASIALKRVEQSESDHRSTLARLDRISDSIEKVEARGRYNISHLLQFGVVAEDRDRLRDELASVRLTGDRSVREVIRSIRRDRQTGPQRTSKS